MRLIDHLSFITGFRKVSVLAILSLTISTNVSAAPLVVTHTYTDGQVLTEGLLNDNFDDVETYVSNNDRRIIIQESQLQNLATGCGANEYLRGIAADGTLSCFPDISATGGGGTDTLGALLCNPGQIAKLNSLSQWKCGTDNDTDTIYTKGTGIQILNNVISSEVVDTDTLGALALTCSTGQVSKLNNLNQWKCGTDVDTNTTYIKGTGIEILGNVISSTVIDTTYTAGAGINISTLNEITTKGNLANLTCADNEVAKYTQVTGLWRCATDIDTNTIYTKGTGIDIINDRIFSTVVNTDTLAEMITSCQTGEVAKKVAGQWKCETDINTDSAGVAFASSTASINLPILTPTNTTTTIQSVRITVPGPGQVIVSFSAYYRILHTTGTIDQFDIGIAATEGVAIDNTLASKRSIYIDSGIASGNFFASISSHAVFGVSVGGVYDYFILGKSNKGVATSSLYVSHPATQAIFVPKNYN